MKKEKCFFERPKKSECNGNLGEKDCVAGAFQQECCFTYTKFIEGIYTKLGFRKKQAKTIVAINMKSIEDEARSR